MASCCLQWKCGHSDKRFPVAAPDLSSELIEQQPTPGILRKLLQGQRQPCPLVLYLIGDMQLDKKDCDDIWRMKVSDGTHSFDNALYVNTYKKIPNSVFAPNRKVTKIILFDYEFTTRDEQSQRKFDALKVNSFCLVDLTVSEAVKWKRCSATTRLQWNSGTPSNDKFWILDCSETDLRFTLCTEIIRIELDALKQRGVRMTSVHIVEDKLRRVKRGQKRYANLHWVEYAACQLTPLVHRPTNPDLSKCCHVAKLYDEKRVATSTTAGHSYRFAAPTIDDEYEFRQFIMPARDTIEMTLLDEVNSLWIRACAVVTKTSYSNTIACCDQRLRCMQICVAVYKVDKSAPANVVTKPILCGTYNCSVENVAHERSLVSITMNPRNGDLIVAFNEGLHDKHGLYHITLPQKAKSSVGNKAKGKVLYLKPVATDCQLRWPSSAAQYTTVPYEFMKFLNLQFAWVWRHNGEQLITLLRGPDRHYIVIYKISYGLGSKQNHHSMSVTGAKFLSWFESDTPKTIVKQNWPPELIGSCGRFLVFGSIGLTPDFFLVDLGFDGRSLPVRLQHNQFIVVTKTKRRVSELLVEIERNQQKYLQFFNDQDRKVTEKSLHSRFIQPGGVLVVGASMFFEGNYGLSLLMKCDFSSVLRDYKRFVHSSNA